MKKMPTSSLLSYKPAKESHYNFDVKAICSEFGSTYRVRQAARSQLNEGRAVGQPEKIKE